MAAESVFHCAIRSQFQHWQALQLAIEHGMGGPYAKEKVAWMADVTEAYFRENSNLSRDEVEDFIAEVLNNEFDTIAEDGSIEKMSEMLCEFYVWCKNGQEDKVLHNLEATQASKAASQQATAEVTMQMSDLTLNSENNATEATDEWTVISRKKKK